MRCKTRLVVLIPSLLLSMIASPGGYATAGMGPPEKTKTAINIAALYSSQPVAQADATEQLLEELVRLGRPGLQQTTRSQDHPACQGSCTIPRLSGNLMKKPILKAEGKEITNFIGFNTIGW